MPDPRYANGHRRRQLRARILREETHCGICGNEVDKTLPPHLPGSPEIDERIPVSLGGDPLERTNCRLTHRACNVGRNRKPAYRDNPQHRTDHRPAVTYVTHRQW